MVNTKRFLRRDNQI